MDDPRTGLVAAARRLLGRDRSRQAAATAEQPSARAANGVPTPQQLATERSGTDPVWDC